MIINVQISAQFHLMKILLDFCVSDFLMNGWHKDSFTHGLLPLSCEEHGLCRTTLPTTTVNWLLNCTVWACMCTWNGVLSSRKSIIGSMLWLFQVLLDLLFFCSSLNYSFSFLKTSLLNERLAELCYMYWQSCSWCSVFVVKSVRTFDFDWTS